METVSLTRSEVWSRIGGCDCFTAQVRDKSVTLVVTVPADDLPVG